LGGQFVGGQFVSDQLDSGQFVTFRPGGRFVCGQFVGGQFVNGHLVGGQLWLYCLTENHRINKIKEISFSFSFA